MNRSLLLSAFCFFSAAVCAQTAPAPIAQGIDIQQHDKQQENESQAAKAYGVLVDTRSR